MKTASRKPKVGSTSSSVSAFPLALIDHSAVLSVFVAILAIVYHELEWLERE